MGATFILTSGSFAKNSQPFPDYRRKDLATSALFGEGEKLKCYFVMSGNAGNNGNVIKTEK